jgi:hypothetical protein
MPVQLTGGTPSPEMLKIMALVHGFAGTGKTELSFSFPPPYWMYNLDRSVDHIVPKLPAGVTIEYEHIPDDVDNTSAIVARSHLDKFDALLKAAIKANEGTFIVDGYDLLWDLVKIAKVRNLDEDLPKEYAPANSYMNSALRRLHMAPGLQVALTTMSSKIWTGAKTETERVKADGFKHRDRWLTHEVYLFTPDNTREPFAKPSQGNTGQTHQAYIAQSKLNESLVGRVLPSLTFALLYKLTFGQGWPEAEKLWSPAKAAAAKPAEVTGATT